MFGLRIVRKEADSLYGGPCFQGLIVFLAGLS